MTRENEAPNLCTNRRNLLKGTVLASAALMGGTSSANALAGSNTKMIHKFGDSYAKTIPVADKVTVDGDLVDLSHLPRVKQELVMPPFAPTHDQVAKGGPKIIEVTLTTTEKKMLVDEDNDGYVWALTYNGSVPGPMIVVHEGDYVEVTLINPEESQMEHNIDCPSLGLSPRL